MSVELIFIELLLGAMLLGFLGSYKKRIIDRAILLATVPLSFIISIVACERISGKIGQWLSGTLVSPDMPEAISSLIGALIVSLSGPFAATLLFIVLLLVLRIGVGLILFIVHTVIGTRRREKRARREGKKKKPLYNKIATAVMGVVSGYLVCMLSFMPFAYLSDLTEPMITTAKSDEYNGTYVNDLALQLDTLGMPFSDGSVLSGVATATGMRAIYNASIRGLTDTTVTLSDGKAVEFNSLELVNSVSTETVRALALAERACKAEATFETLSPAAGILRELSSSELLMTLTADVLTKLEPQELPDDADFGDKIMNLISTEYTTGDARIVKNEVAALSALIELLSADMKDVALSSAELMPELLAYLENPESSEKMVNTISDATIYDKGFPLFMEFGLELICDQMNLSESKEEDYSRYLADMQAAFNDKTIKTYQKDRAEAFIKYCAETGQNPTTYAIEDRDDMTDTDRAYVAYLSFFARMEFIRSIFSDYSVAEHEHLYYSYLIDGESYYYFGSGELEGTELYRRWVKDNGMLTEYVTALGLSEILGIDAFTHDAASVAAALLTHEINEIDTYNTSFITVYDIMNMATDAKSALGASPEHEEAARILDSLICIDGYNAAPAYKKDILAALHKDKALDDKKVAENISTVAVLYGDLTEHSDVASFDTVMTNFVKVGAMLDSFAEMETTADIPNKMLDVLVRDKAYGVYFRMDPVLGMIEKARSGEISYEELFGEVAALYSLMNTAPAEN